MASPVDIELPPGFSEMSREEQIRYAQKLWDYVAPGPDDVPIPDWQIQQAEQSIEAHIKGEMKTFTWDEVKARVQSKNGDAG